MRISVKSDIKLVQKKLNSIQRRQIPFAASNAINDTAFEVRAHEQRAIQTYIDRPTAFTVKGVQVRKASKRKLFADVFIPPNRWKYMRFAVQGGSPGGTSNIPVNAKLNRFGSMGRTYVRRMANKPGNYVGKIGGTSGIWERGNGPLRLLVYFKSGVNYRRRFDFQGIGVRHARRIFRVNMDKRLRHALATAK